MPPHLRDDKYSFEEYDEEYQIHSNLGQFAYWLWKLGMCFMAIPNKSKIGRSVVRSIS